MVNGIDIDLLRSWLCCSAILENRELHPSYILNTSNPDPTFNIHSIPYSYTHSILLILLYSFHSLFLLIPFFLIFNIHSIPYSYSFHSSYPSILIPSIPHLFPILQNSLYIHDLHFLISSHSNRLIHLFLFYPWYCIFRSLSFHSFHPVGLILFMIFYSWDFLISEK